MEVQTVQTIKYRAPFDFESLGWKGRETGRGSELSKARHRTLGRTSKCLRDGPPVTLITKQLLQPRATPVPLATLVFCVFFCQFDCLI